MPSFNPLVKASLALSGVLIIAVAVLGWQLDRAWAERDSARVAQRSAEAQALRNQAEIHRMARIAWENKEAAKEAREQAGEAEKAAGDFARWANRQIDQLAHELMRISDADDQVCRTLKDPLPDDLMNKARSVTAQEIE